jgi:hypothetical protein
MPRRAEAGIHQGLWPIHRPPIRPLLVRTLHHGGAALSTAVRPLNHSQYRFLKVQIDGNVFRYSDIRMLCIMRAVVFAHTGGSFGDLNTLAVITGNVPVCTGARGIDGVYGTGNETGMVLLATLSVTAGQKLSLWNFLGYKMILWYFFAKSDLACRAVCLA